ncbi:MAG TPA: hypothetical protein VIS03_04195 [Kiloniellaceae bacterium]
MFAVDLPVASLYARFAGRGREVRRTARAGEPQDLIRQALAEMVPATAGEISEATGLDSLVTEATLEHMAARYQVMFNPLTKRFSLPKLWAARRFAA